MKKVLTCVGTRPNFIKITQLEKHFRKHPSLEYTLLHTGQHFDDNMSDVFFKELSIKQPDVFLNINKGSQLDIICNIINKMEEFLKSYQPDLVMVPGDVNSSFACAFAANRLNIPVAHIESGLRSFDKLMPEEVNRILIDDLSNLFFVTEQSGIDNLLSENKKKDNIHFVGNTMIDTLVAFKPFIDSSEIINRISASGNKPIASITFHRPSNVDNVSNLEKIVRTISLISQIYKVVFPLHPRTKANLHKLGLIKIIETNPDIILTAPMGYIDFMKLISESEVVITDSGGIQEETTFLSIPCLTVRTTTERPVTIIEGTNKLLELDSDKILEEVSAIKNNKYKTGKIPQLWDGRSSERIVDIISKYLT